MGRELVLSVAFLAVAGCGRFGFAPGGDDVAEIDAPIPFDSPQAVVPAICAKRTISTVLTGDSATVVRATALGSGGFAVAIGTAAGTVHVARIRPDGSFVSLHTPLSGGYRLHGAAAVGDSVFLYAVLGATAYVKALDPSWDGYRTAQSGNDAVIDPPLAVMPNGKGWLGMISGGSTMFGEIASDGSSTGLVADYQPVTTTASSFVSAPAGVRAAIDRGDGTCETIVIAETGVTSLRETVPACSFPQHAPFVGDTGGLLYTQPGAGLVVRSVNSIANDVATVHSLGTADTARIATRAGLTWIAYATGSSTVELAQLGPEGLVVGAAPDVRAPYDLLATGVFWVEGSELLTGDTCVN